MIAQKEDIIRRFDAIAPRRQYWREKNQYYYNDQETYMRFLIPAGRSVLEFGCATGDLLNSLNPSRDVGIDISADMIHVARGRFPELDFRTGDIEDIAPWGETFDFIILADVVGHLFDIQAAFNRLHPFCRPDTRIIVSYYNFLWEPALKLAEKIGRKMPQQHQNWLSSIDIANLLNLARFQAVKTESRFLIPIRIPGLSNFINRYLAALPGVRRLCISRYIVARQHETPPIRDHSTSIVIPCRNERDNIRPAVERLPAFGECQEIIFVDGHSTDGTPKEILRVIEEFPGKDIKLLVQDGTGKGDAVRKGFDAATGDILMILDADLTVPPEDLPKFYDALTNDLGEFINGCRLIYPMEKQAMRYLNYLGNKFFSMMFTWILNQPFKDTLCGTKVLFRRDYAKIKADRAYFGDFDPFGDFDLIFGAVKQNLKIVEMPVRYRERVYGVTNIHRFRHGWLLLKMTVFAFKKIKAI